MSTKPKFARALPMEDFPFSEAELAALHKTFPHGVIALDLETTGLSPLTDRIIEIGAVKIVPHSSNSDSNKKVDKKSTLNNFQVEVFDELIDPRIPIPQITTRIHGIDDTMIIDRPTIDEILPEFLDFMDGLPIVAHNALFDIGFLVFNIHHLENLNSSFPNNEVFCSCRLSRSVFKEFNGHGLAKVTESLNIQLDNHHRAYDDALACLKVFGQALIKQSHEQHYLSSKLFHLGDFEAQKDFDIPEHIVGLRDFIPEQIPVMIKYKGGSYGKDFRPIRAISMLPMPSGSILYAHCLLSDLYKSFALKKIKGYREMTKKELEEFKEKLNT